MRILAAIALIACACSGESDGQPGGDDSAVRPLDAGPSDAAPPARRVEHAVFHLGDNRLLAHQLRDGALHIPAGSGGFDKYARFGVPKLRWSRRQQRDGAAVAVMRSGASISFPLTSAQIASPLELSLRIHAPVARSMTVKWNGHPLGKAIALTAGWQTLSVPIPEAHPVAGENAVRFDVRGSASKNPLALAWLQVGGPVVESNALAYSADADSFSMPRGVGLAYYVLVPPTANLVADVRGAGCVVEVSARTADESLTGALRSSNSGVDLSSLAGSVARLELVASGCETTGLAGARITVAGDAPKPHSAPPPDHIVLLVMDALRADRVALFNPDARAEIPNYERLAARGTVFRNFWVEGNESQASHSSFWTSLYPAVHDVRTAGPNENHVLADRFTKLPQLMKDAGLFALGATANGYVTRSGGYGGTFDEFTNLMRARTFYANGQIPGHKIAGYAADRIAERMKAGRVFAYVGMIDTHAPWITHEPWIKRYDPRPYNGPHQAWVDLGELGVVPGKMQCTGKPTQQRELDRMLAIYDTDVSFGDRALGVLLDRLDELGITDETLIIVTADHGEEMFEHSRCGHGGSLKETLVHVPLIMSYPPLFPQGAVIEAGVDGVDLLPTLLEALGRPALDQAQGASLVSLAQGIGGDYVRPVYASQYEYAHAMRLGDWKLVVDKRGVDRLYRMSTDPFERTSVSRKRPIERRFVTDALSTFLINRAQWKKSAWGVASNLTADGARALDEPG